MIPGESSIAVAYLEHFTDRDLALLKDGDPATTRAQLNGNLWLGHAEGFENLLGSPRVYEAVFAPSGKSDPLLAASPFFVFAVAVQRASAQLSTRSYVSEWLGPGRRAPVFDVDQLREFMASSWHRFFLTELLASYTHVASGSVVVPTRRGLRRHRFSELDPVRLAGLLEVVSDVERPGILRRLGDLALFLTGVFPDYTAERGFGQIEEDRLLRLSGLRAGQAQLGPRDPQALGDRGAVGLLEQLGRRWYRAAFDLLPHPVADNVAVLGELPEHFNKARRMLGVITEDYLFPHRDRWFGLTGN